jgi:hypothetical protein
LGYFKLCRDTSMRHIGFGPKLRFHSRVIRAYRNSHVSKKTYLHHKTSIIRELKWREFGSHKHNGWRQHRTSSSREFDA